MRSSGHRAGTASSSQQNPKPGRVAGPRIVGIRRFSPDLGCARHFGERADALLRPPSHSSAGRFKFAPDLRAELDHVVQGGLKLGEQPKDRVGVFGLLLHKAHERTPLVDGERACSIWWFKMSRRSRADGMAHSIQPRFPPSCRRTGGFFRRRRA